jgi:uncharacterized protein (TIGR02145 family)
MRKILLAIIAVVLLASPVSAGLVIKSSAPAFTCGVSTVLDADNNSYNTVLVNDQCWMAKNLNVGVLLDVMGEGPYTPTNNSIIEKWCRTVDEVVDCISYGGLYQWDEAMNYVTTPGAQGICPAGWHIPTDAQFYALENYLKDEGQTCSASRTAYDCATAGTKLKSGGSSGMEVLLGGTITTETLNFSAATSTYLMGSSEGNDNTRFIPRLLTTGETGNGTKVSRSMSVVKANVGISVRCLKD